MSVELEAPRMTEEEEGSLQKYTKVTIKRKTELVCCAIVQGLYGYTVITWDWLVAH